MKFFSGLSTKKRILVIVVLLLLIISLPLFIWAFLTQDFDLRKRAFSSENPSGPGSVHVVPSSSRVPVGRNIPVEVQFDTGGVGISSISFRVISSQADLFKIVSDSEGTFATSIVPNTNLSSDWSFPVNSVEKSGGQWIIDFAAVYASTGGYVSNGVEKMAHFYIEPVSSDYVGQEIIFELDSTQTKMISKDTALDIIGVTSQGIVEIVEASTTISSITFKYPSPNEKFFGSTYISFDRLDDANDVAKLIPITNSYITESNGTITLTDLDLGDLPVGSGYNVYVVTTSHLRRSLGVIDNLIYGQNLVNLSTSSKLIAGDFDENNILNIIDIGKILSVYTQLSTPVNSDNARYDVNFDEVIDIRDIGAVLSNYTRLETLGD